jgi:hypothetical protein
MLSSSEHSALPVTTERSAGCVNSNQKQITHCNKDGKTNKENKYTN